ncbi:hypothetical protein [Marasmitruncus massiliensis]|uniref:hypothetical protein n=1 Tax=Marasmitruncus massiliensis TaxID=1944642 RepID=UPI000C7B5BD7|nr:hypothetical protein [Marasmitruncus massiliensis]
MRGVDLPYIKQGLIYFTCRNFNDQPAIVQHKINNLCLECGKDHYQALFEVVTSSKSISRIAMDHHIDESWLYQLRKRFYVKW